MLTLNIWKTTDVPLNMNTMLKLNVLLTPPEPVSMMCKTDVKLETPKNKSGNITYYPKIKFLPFSPVQIVLNAVEL